MYVVVLLLSLVKMHQFTLIGQQCKTVRRFVGKGSTDFEGFFGRIDKPETMVGQSV
jgi:hypothetical protein